MFDMMDDACIKKLPRKAKLDHKYYDFFMISLYLCLVQKILQFFFFAQNVLTRTCKMLTFSSKFHIYLKTWYIIDFEVTLFVRSFFTKNYFLKTSL